MKKIAIRVLTVLCLFCSVALFCCACKKQMHGAIPYSLDGTNSEAQSSNAETGESSETDGTEESGEETGEESTGGDTGDDDTGDEEGGGDDDDDGDETPPDETPPNESENKVTVHFIGHNEQEIFSQTYEKGYVLTAEDMPICPSEAGYRCLWSFTQTPLMGDVTCIATAYKEISDAEDFVSVETYGRYILTNDILFADGDVQQICESEERDSVIARFEGVLEGNGCKISNVRIAGNTARHFIGVLDGIIRNVTFENVTFAGTTPIYGAPTASDCALIGKTCSEARIENCQITATFSVTALQSKPSAGLALDMEGGTFTNCTLTCFSPTNSAEDNVYAVCVWLQSSVSIEGITLTQSSLPSYREKSETPTL